MKKFIFILPLLSIILSASSHPPPNDFVYSIIFSGPFKNDMVSISINKQVVVNRLKVENVQASNKGHLNLIQNEEGITINYNGCQLKKPKVPVNFILALDIFVNGQQKKINIDLRKGKVIIINAIASNLNLGKVEIGIEQITEPFLFI